MRRVVAPGVKGGGELQHFCRTKFNAETAGFTTLGHDGYSPFSQSFFLGDGDLPCSDYGVGGSQSGVTLITGGGDVRHGVAWKKVATETGRDASRIVQNN